MLTLVWIIQIFCAILLTVLVLLHSPKGDGLAAIGGMANLFSSQKSAESGLNKLTFIIVLIFIISSLITGFHGINIFTFLILGFIALMIIAFIFLTKK